MFKNTKRHLIPISGLFTIVIFSIFQNCGTQALNGTSATIANSSDVSMTFNVTSPNTIVQIAVYVGGLKDLRFSDGTSSASIQNNILAHTFSSVGTYTVTATDDNCQVLQVVNSVLTEFQVNHLPTLQSLALFGNHLTVFDTSQLPNTLQQLILMDNNISNLNPGFLPAGLTYLSLGYNRLSSSTVDQVLMQRSLANQSSGYIFLDNQSASATPSATGINYRSTLIGRGVTVQTD